MPDSDAILDFLIPLLVVLLLNWLFLQPTQKSRQRLSREINKKLRETPTSRWHEAWARIAIVLGNIYLFFLLFFKLSGRIIPGLPATEASGPFLLSVTAGIVIVASGHASRIYCIIDSLVTLFLEQPPVVYLRKSEDYPKLEEEESV